MHKKVGALKIKKYIAVLSIFMLSGCNSVLVSYVKPQTENLAKIKLPKDTGDTSVLYKIGELDEQNCASKFTTVRDSSYNDYDNVLVYSDRGIVLHVNASTKKVQCSGSQAMTLDKGKQYEADILPFPYVCGVFVYEISEGKRGKAIETHSLFKGCVKK